MAVGYLDSQYLTNIADAIRTKAGTTATMSVSEMPTAISNISSGVSMETYNVLLTRRFNTTNPFNEIKWGNLTYLPDYCFAGMVFQDNTDIVLPSFITGIGVGAFNNARCSTGITGNMCSLTIPNTVTSLPTLGFIKDSMVFKTLNLFCTVDYLPYSTVQGIGTRIHYVNMANIKKIETSNFSSVSTLREVIVYDTLEEISDRVFYSCSNLEKIVLPSSLTTIGNNVGYSCRNLVEVHIQATTPPTLGTSCFNSNPTIYVPAAAVSAYQADASWGQYTIVAES